MSFDRHLLDIICCPATRLPLERVPADILVRINERIAEGKLVTARKEVVGEVLTDALMTRDGRIAYPVRDGIPVLLEEQGMLLGQLD